MKGLPMFGVTCGSGSLMFLCEVWLKLVGELFNWEIRHSHLL